MAVTMLEENADKKLFTYDVNTNDATEDFFGSNLFAVRLFVGF